MEILPSYNMFLSSVDTSNYCLLAFFDFVYEYKPFLFSSVFWLLSYLKQNLDPYLKIKHRKELKQSPSVFEA